MLLISKFRDYYDSALGLGIDKTIRYHRETTDMAVGPELTLVGVDKERPYPYHSEGYYSYWDRERCPKYDATPIFVGMAGKVYPGYRLEYEEPRKHPWDYPNKVTQFVYDLDSLKDVITKIGDDYLPRFIEKKQNPKAKSLLWCEENVVKFFAEDYTKVHGHFFTEHKAPIFVLVCPERQRDHLYLNSCLKDVQFFKAVDPFTAFQEISMYISGVLGVDAPDTVTISDVEKARKHGYDKTSFRTATPGKKAKRRGVT